VQVKAVRFASDTPLDEDCACHTCRRYPVGYLRHLLLVGEPTAGRLLTLHNLAWMESLTAGIRHHIQKRTLRDLRNQVAEAWK
jgi:queuine tRNA-ribosyltransferase